MNKKKLFLVTLVGIGTFLGISGKCLAACKADQADTVYSCAQGKGKTGGASSVDGWHATDWVGSGTTIDVTPTEGSNLNGVSFEITDEELKKYGFSPTSTGSNTNLQHAEDWKKEISSLGAVINGETKPSPFQEMLLGKMAEQNGGVSVDEFINMYREDTLRNNTSFEYRDTPYATVCQTGTSNCKNYTDAATCTAEMGDYWGCYGATIVGRACAAQECIGDDAGFVRRVQSCMEIRNDAYACCVEEYGKEYCDYKPQIPNVDRNSCELPDIEPLKYPSKPTPSTPSEGVVACGSSYTTYSYSIGTTSCPYVKTLITTVTTENYPSINSSYMAGDGVNFSNTVSWYSTTTESVWDDSELQNRIAKEQNTINKIDGLIMCLESKKVPLYAQLKSAEHDLSDCQDDVCYGPTYIDPETGLPTQDEESCSCYYEEKAVEEINKQIEAIDNQINAYLTSAEYTSAQAELKNLDECGKRANSFKSTSSSSSGTYSLGNSYLRLGSGSNEYKQIINTIKGIAKNSGQLLTQNELNNFKFPYFPNTDNFVIPIATKNGTQGAVAAVQGGYVLYECPVNVTNLYIGKCTSNCNGNDSNGSLNVIYRPISLTNPFPNTISNGKYRAMGANWNETYTEEVIKNNRGVSDYEVYGLIPIYTIELTPAKIKEIREYNKTVSYNNFDMKCTDGYLCVSNFLWGTTANGYNFSDIIVKSESCATSSGWDACY